RDEGAGARDGVPARHARGRGGREEAALLPALPRHLARAGRAPPRRGGAAPGHARPLRDAELDLLLVPAGSRRQPRAADRAHAGAVPRRLPRAPGPRGAHVTRREIVDSAAAVADDLEFGSARAWLAEDPGRKAAG